MIKTEVNPHTTVHKMEYNASRDQLILKEYGRNVQKLVDYITNLTDKSERTRLAHTLIYLMKQLNPSVKEHHDNPQRIWDHLYVMSDFKLDIDGPFPKPDKSILEQKPLTMPYSTGEVKFKYYGKSIELLIHKALKIEDKELKTSAFGYIARLMRSFYATWNKENFDDSIILEHLRYLTENKIPFDNTIFDEGFVPTPNQNQNKEKEREKVKVNNNQPSQGNANKSGHKHHNKNKHNHTNSKKKQ
jgi:hypothetical protein